MGWDLSLILTALSSSSALTLLVGSSKPVPNMTYDVFGATLNLTQLQIFLTLCTCRNLLIDLAITSQHHQSPKWPTE